MATVFYLLRHGVHAGAAGVLVGRTPEVGLSADGVAQAHGLAQRLRGAGLDRLHTSPMQRCRETAAPIAAAAGLVPITAASLDEIDFGDWTGRSFEDLAQDKTWMHWNAARHLAAAPGGEAMTAVQARAVGYLRQVAHDLPEGRVALVSHGDVIRALVCHVLQLPLQNYANFEIAPGSLTTLVLCDGGGKILGLNHPSAIVSP